MLNRVARVLQLDALRNKALAAFLTAAADDVAAGFGGHACAETELVFAGAFGWLIGALAHGYEELGPAAWRRGGRTLGLRAGLSTRQ